MSTADIAVLLGAIAVVAGLGWYFFGPRRASTARLADGVQRVEVTVRGGYQPNLIRVRQHVPVELVFDRQESGDCTSHVVFSDFGVTATLPAFSRTTVRLDPTRTGTFGFACGMNMIHGTLVVDPADAPTPTPADDTTTATTIAGATAADDEAAQAKERRAAIEQSIDDLVTAARP